MQYGTVWTGAWNFNLIFLILVVQPASGGYHTLPVPLNALKEQKCICMLLKRKVTGILL